MSKKAVHVHFLTDNNTFITFTFFNLENPRITESFVVGVLKRSLPIRTCSGRKPSLWLHDEKLSLSATHAKPPDPKQMVRAGTAARLGNHPSCSLAFYEFLLYNDHVKEFSFA